MTMAHFHILTGAENFHAQPVVRRIAVADLKDVLARGVDDFMAMPSHAVFLCLIYPMLGLILCRLCAAVIALSVGFRICAAWPVRGDHPVRAEP
jgi:uncharacterized membrane protein